VREWGRGLHEDLVRVIRQVRPQRVLTWSPEWNWPRFRSCHPAHLATGAAVLAAIYPDASNPFALTHLKEDEGLDAWTAGEAWLLNSPQREINHYVDITGRSHGRWLRCRRTRARSRTRRACRNGCASASPRTRPLPGCPRAGWVKRSRLS
jgi:LmbE family N-acetylglucosaminyl deacetylase